MLLSGSGEVSDAAFNILVDMALDNLSSSKNAELPWKKQSDLALFDPNLVLELYAGISSLIVESSRQNLDFDHFL